MSDAADQTPANEDSKPTDSGPTKRAIKIGSQRPGHENVGRAIKEKPPTPTIDGAAATTWEAPPEAKAPQAKPPVSAAPTAEARMANAPVAPPASPTDSPEEDAPKTDFAPAPKTEDEVMAEEMAKAFPKPRVSHLSTELQEEIDAALDGVSLDALMDGGSSATSRGPEPEIDSRVRATVVKLHREDVFFSLPGNYEAITPLKHFDENPEVGAEIEVTVNRRNPEDGLYEVSIPGATASVQDWSDLEAGMTVEAKVTGHNTGGLECDVNGIGAFMPVSQISLYRVEDLEQFVGEKWACIVNEANPARGNLVISRRGVLEREKEGQKEQLMQAIQVGQEREGIVRSLRDFGAFVDIGGVDGLIHISKLSWERIKHPSEVLEEGEKVKVKIEKIEDGKIGLSLRDMGEHPWQKAAADFVPNSIVTGTVSKIMDFGAFVKVGAGVEGLVHISELAHHRVVRVANVVSEGQEVSVKIISVDPENQRMSLSMKAVQAPPASKSDKKKDDDIDEPPRPSAVKKFQGKLQGGTNKKTGGEQFGLNW